PFPQMNTSANKDFIEQSPILAEWVSVFMQKYADYMKQDAEAKTGIHEGMSEAEIEQKGKAYAQKEMTTAMQGGMDAMKFLEGKNLPGVDMSQVREAMSELGGEAKEHHIKLANKEIGTDAPPDWDTGSVFA